LPQRRAFLGGDVGAFGAGDFGRAVNKAFNTAGIRHNKMACVR